MNPVVWPWMIEISLMTYRSLNGEHFQLTGAKNGPGGVWLNNGRKRPPLPSELLASVIAFGGAGIIAESNPRVGALFAWGLVLATAITMFGKAKANQTPQQTLLGG